MSGESVGPEGGLLVAGLPFRSFGAESLGPAASLGSVLTSSSFVASGVKSLGRK